MEHVPRRGGGRPSGRNDICAPGRAWLRYDGERLGIQCRRLRGQVIPRIGRSALISFIFGLRWPGSCCPAGGSCDGEVLLFCASDCCRRCRAAWIKGCRGAGLRRHFVALRNESDAPGECGVLTIERWCSVTVTRQQPPCGDAGRCPSALRVGVQYGERCYAVTIRCGR